TLTHALQVGSPVIDAGDNTLTPLAAAYDQRDDPGRFPRIAHGPNNPSATVDIGAFEASPAIQDITDQITVEDGPLVLPFTVGVEGSGFETITATSSNTTLVPNDASTSASAAPASTSN